MLGVVAACGKDSAPRPVEPPDASVPEACDGGGVVACAGACVNTGVDPAHCGACDNACASEEVCEEGACVAVCRIDGQQVASGTVNPANACEVCLPATSTARWSARRSIPLLVGGGDLTAQGWTVVSEGPSTLSYGADHVRLATSTITGERSSGRLLITREDAFDGTRPFRLEVTLQVETVNRHNTLDSGAAILGGITPPFGTAVERSKMVYLDSAAIGWADETQSAAFPVVDGAYHVYEFAVDAAKVATVSVDGVAKLTRNNFTSNGTLAIGDQTEDPSVDGAMRIKSVDLLCPPGP
ncbi:hypothetical protein MFUL124B02_31120 [Myxococcus fulvus 124B02]|nr:hypothetical protein MFUL124B02_31120 [Myxococcus fulvus 124B02]